MDVVIPPTSLKLLPSPTPLLPFFDIKEVDFLATGGKLFLGHEDDFDDDDFDGDDLDDDDDDDEGGQLEDKTDATDGTFFPFADFPSELCAKSSGENKSRIVRDEDLNSMIRARPRYTPFTEAQILQCLSPQVLKGRDTRMKEGRADSLRTRRLHDIKDPAQGTGSLTDPDGGGNCCIHRIGLPPRRIGELVSSAFRCTGKMIARVLSQCIAG